MFNFDPENCLTATKEKPFETKKPHILTKKEFQSLNDVKIEEIKLC